MEGTTDNGNDWVAGAILVVSTAKGGTRSPLAGRVPEALAEQRLWQLARRARRHGNPPVG